MRRASGVLVVMIAALLAIAGPGQTESVPDSHSVANPDLRIGAVFMGNSVVHGCSGSVIDSREGDLVITAAHCMIGSGAFIGFSPGYNKGANPKGMWNVTQIYQDPRWVNGYDVNHDYAILRVVPGFGAPQTSIENAVGGGFHVTKNPTAGDLVSMTGYGVGLFDSPTSCTQPAGVENGYSSFTCDGFVYGTSGGPWVAANSNDLVGIIAGPHLGGCTSGVSYTPPFDQSLYTVIRRAEDHAQADTAPITNIVNDC